MTVKEYIEENIELIDNNQWEELFDYYKHDLVPLGVGGVLYEAGIYFLDKLSYIPACAFASYETLTDITIPDNITKIGASTFAGCFNLKNIIMSDFNNVEEIEIYAFSGCNSLTKIILPNVKIIRGNAFRGCCNLKTIILGKNVTSIEKDAFTKLPDNFEIYYQGTKNEWKQVYKPANFEGLYFTVHCSDGDIIKRKR
jgi:hypothetical protein